MSTELGGGGSLPIGNQSSIEIPSSEAPEKVLRVDVVIPLPNQDSGLTPAVDSYKFKAASGDLTPNYLDAKIDTDQFNVTSNLLTLIGFNGLTTDNLTVGSTNLYFTSTINDEIDANTALAHTHRDLTLLNTYYQTEVNLSSAVSLKHNHAHYDKLEGTTESFTIALKAQYDALVSGNISSVTTPLALSVGGVLSHNNNDGNKHIPSNASATAYDVLTSGTTGVYTWENINDIISNVAIFEATPSTSTVLGVQSAYLKTHIDNGTTNIKHVTDANLTYINTTIPNHIADTSVFKHIPTIIATTDQGKFLFINTSDEPEWTVSSTSISIVGQTYLTASGGTITAAKVTLAQTELIAGDYLSISGNTLNATQRDILGSSDNGNNTTSISAGWAYTHENATGVGSHIPTGGTAIQYVAGDGTIKDFEDAPGQTYKVVLSAGGPTGNLDTRLTGATFPTGWSGAKDTVTTDLNITHTVGSNVVDITIWANDGTDITKLMNTAAYTTLVGNQAKTIIKIASLATIDEPLDIYLQFE